MATIVKRSLIVLGAISLVLVILGGYLLGFANLLSLPKQIYTLRWRDYTSASVLVKYWGVESFNSELWRRGVNRGPQAMSLFFSKYLEGKRRSDVINELGTPDGDYVGSEKNLSYLLFRHVVEKDEKKQGARWSMIVEMRDDVFKEIKFYKGCCEN